MMNQNSSPRILLAVTGSIAAYKAADLTSKLVQAGYELQILLSTGAKNFVGPSTFEGLSGKAPLEGVFEPHHQMAHIHLARWADLFLIYPATAHTITKLSQGDGSDLIGTLFLAQDFKKPVWIAPAMNPAMLKHPAVQEARSRLSQWGVTLLESPEGRMACGEQGEGRLLEPTEMLERLEAHFKKKARPFRVLVTAGGTSERIDAVRTLSNVSTGTTGCGIARALQNAGMQTQLLLSATAAQDPGSVPTERFSDFKDLDERLKTHLSKNSYDAVIHAAAVSDYSVDSLETLRGQALDPRHKIHSGEAIRLILKPNPKIINRLRGYSKNPEILVVSFKLTTQSESPSFGDYDSDYLVHNDLSGLNHASDRHEGAVYSNRSQRGESVGEKLREFKNQRELEGALLELLEKERDSR